MKGYTLHITMRKRGLKKNFWGIFQKGTVEKEQGMILALW